MTNLLNSLFVTTEGAGVHVEGTSLRVVVDKQTKMQVPLHHLASLVCFAKVYVSPDAMAACAEAGTAVVFLGWNGRYLARVEGRDARSAVLRREQYRAADDASRTLALARGFVGGKVANARTALRRAARTREQASETIDAAADRLARLVNVVVDAETLDVLRGFEGEAASRYFDVLDAMIAMDGMRFEKRTRRPPSDPVNAMLSFGYSLLSADCQSAAQAAGLDPAVGFLHVERSGRPALALDLMEELRPVVVDRLVVSSVRLGQFGPADFEMLPTGECRFRDAARKRFIVEYQQRKRDPIAHPLAADPVPWVMVPLIQARLLARAIRREVEYVPFLVK
ncbi:MAG TPA: type I-C CRISPR-associated endonuclease Cas1c [Kofleriaceae bacterium]|jgi:CRISPR-associated protein Cas1